jgi:hypothetical protein
MEFLSRSIIFWSTSFTALKTLKKATYTWTLELFTRHWLYEKAI